MKRKYLSIAVMSIVLIIIIAVVGFKPVKKTMHTSFKKGFAVVELFTSEGCSSCPAADETVARLLSKNMENVYILAYHVDYWNRLGWKDPFSKAEYSQRQSQYATKFELNSVYTPQVIVNGSAEFVGSDEDKLKNTVENNLAKPGGQVIALSATKSNNLVSVNYDINGSEAVLLNLALVQPEATISVKRGENGGRMLHHVNIVRALKTVDAKGKGSVTLDIPDELKGVTLQLIAYTQSKKNFEILGAEKAPL
jgi:hypothetical protein